MKTPLQRIADRGRSMLSGRAEFEYAYDRAMAQKSKRYIPELDLVYVLPPAEHHGWILDAICREIDTYVEGRTSFVELHDTLPPAKAIFYSHYAYFRDTVLRQPDVLNARNVLFFTHPRDLWFSKEELKYSLSLADSVIGMCSHFQPFVQELGLPGERIHTALVGADPALFRPHQRGSGGVGFCSSYLPRKGGDRILNLVKALPDRAFTLCGRNWEDWEGFEELNALPNFSYLDIPYKRYAEFYDSIDVFVSVSELEGGPVPLIEAAMSNVIPVCSNTGHAADIIRHGENGFIFPIDASIDVISQFINRAFEIQSDVRSTVVHLSWERFSHQVQSIAGLREQGSSTGSLLLDAA